MYFQDIIINLQNYWQKQGCAIIQPIDSKVGAATFHTATILKSLEEGVWNAAYVQSCTRPSDGRYAKNPNRMQKYYQFQVIMKPSPEDIQQKCIDSFKIFGIDKRFHDIRFVHSDWENPTIGASGLGWEIWCNGMEIAQFTYMQQVGSIQCINIPGEISYGLERLAMYIQNKNSVWDLVWNDKGLTYKNIFYDSEIENCISNFEILDTEILTQHFKDYEKITKDLLQRNLIAPAYDYAINASHLFNLLDARGVLSVTQRAHYISKIRELVRECCIKYQKKFCQRNL